MQNTTLHENSTNHYDKKYWQSQKIVGEFGGEANLFKFEKYIKPSDDILDLGCGGGYLLNNIKTSGKKIGIDINPNALENAKKFGIDCYTDITMVEDNSCDIAISHHCLEHVESPSDYLKNLIRIIRPGGRLVIVVPHETTKRIKMNDVDFHLYTWTPQNLKNLLTFCGIQVEECGRIEHTWPPKYRFIQKVFGWKVFNFFCNVWSRMTRRYQTYAVGIINKD